MPDFVQRSDVSLQTARQLIDAAIAHAEPAGVAFAITVTDSSGHIVASARMDGTPLGAGRLSADKAYTACLWQMPSGDLRLSSQPGGDDWGINSTEGGRVVVYDGGFPIVAGGVFAGAIGVSGGTGAQDAACARAALDAVFPQG